MSRHRRTTIRAQCCPTRKAVDGVHCRWHGDRTLTLELRAGPAPAACPHCQASSGWFGDQMTRHCVYGGQWWDRPMAVRGSRRP